jgi:O-antigen ligase
LDYTEYLKRKWVIVALLFVLLFNISIWITFGGVILLLIIIAYNSFKENVIILLALIGFLAFTGDEFESYRNIINAVLFILLLAIYFRKYGLDISHYKKIPKELTYFLFLYFASISLSTIFSHNINLGVMVIVRSILFFIIGYILYSFIQDKRALYFYLLSLFIIIVIIGSTLLYDFSKTGFSGYLLQGLVNRFGGIYGNPNYVGLLIVVSLPILLALFKINIWPGKQKVIILSLMLIFEVIILILSDSRASMLGTFAGSLFILFHINKKIFIRLTLPALFIVIIIVILVPDLQNFLDIYLRLQRINNREIFWQAGFDIINDHPFLGVGPDMFDKYFNSYIPSFANDIFASGNWVVGKPHPHNFFLFYFAENGIMGLITAIMFFVIFFYLALKSIQRTRNNDPDLYYLTLGISGVGIGVFIRSFYEITGILTYGYITRDLAFWIIFIILIHIYYVSGKSVPGQNSPNIFGNIL